MKDNAEREPPDRSAGDTLAADGKEAIHRIYQAWIRGELSSEDALFAIGDVLEGLRPEG